MYNKSEYLEKFLKIRYFEQSLDKLFEDQKIFGTYHRCIGQESIALAFTWFLDKRNDFVVSNHRNHGHYLAFTGNYKALLDEIGGKKTGASGGKGGSQVVMDNNFFSNGILGSTISIATGIAMGFKMNSLNNIVVCFLGDGALGTGISYESFNLASLYNLPILFVVENNGVAQSTKLETNLSGSIKKRFDAFNIENFEINGDDVDGLMRLGEKLTKDIKKKKLPKAVHVKINRLCAHSKGDEIDNFKYFSEINDPLDTIKKIVDNKNDHSNIETNSQKFIKKLIEDFNS